VSDPAAFPTQPPGVAWPTIDWPTDLTDAYDEQLNEAFTDPLLGETYAVVVVQGGRVLAERYGNALAHFDKPPTPVTADTPLLSWSMAKSMTHFLVGTLVDEGRLDPLAPAAVPEWADPRDPRHAITVADLLAMRDGLDFNEAYVLDQPSHVVDMLFGEGQQDTAGYTARRPLAHEPGSVFNYSSGTTNLLSRLVADQVGPGDPYRAYLQSRLFDAIGMRSATATFDAAGTFIGSSYVYATARDFAKFGLLYLRGGTWGDEQLVSRDWVRTARVPVSVDEESGYGYSWQWWVRGDDYGTFAAHGYEGQRVTVIPALDAIIVRCGKTASDHYPALRAWQDRLIAALAAAYAPSKSKPRSGAV